ncbi:Virus X resistance protein-like, coiled-coil domain [Sesbania bispinosa]|nr:Virus X resistance protein-like, coiled-coil domain [Sesbania bispinosa]
MAEQIPYCVASSLIVRLSSAAFRELGRIYGVMDELKRLKDTVESIKAVLLDAEERQERDHSVKIWIRRLKDVLHPADDLLDEFAIHEMTHNMDSGHKNKVKEVFHSLSLNRIVFRHDMAHKIEKIRRNFNDVVQEMSQLNLSPRAGVVKQTDSVRRETSSFVLESDIIGRENSKKEIISFLRQTHTNQNVSVIAIVGIGGLGKTALAQLVYNDVEVQNFFEKRMWVCVSDNFDVKTIVRNMLESLIGSKIDDKLSLDNLQNVLRENLIGKRYMLVLDDIWNESLEKWAQLRTYLMCGAQGSKVLVTTRSKTVAQTMGISDPFVLNGLTSEESWSLLKKITFGDDTRRVNQTLESTGKKIAEKCKGVPLAIRTLGGVLQSKSEESEWIGVLQGDFWKLCEEEDSIMPVLKLSYQNLTPQQKQCFAYCSLYPKDWKIMKDELIQQWMAQGYLECSTEEEQLMEDVGNQIVKVFLMKSIFQDAKMKEHGVIMCFKMHDLMHDLAMHVAGNDCCYLDSEAKRLVGRPMHVWLDNNDNAFRLLGSLDANRLRTFILLSSSLKNLKKEELFVISKFKYLRVLKLSHLSLGDLSAVIGKMKHLRYLYIDFCDKLVGLPESISNLVCLQTWKWVTCEKEIEFSTKVFSKLINLRHLDIECWKASNEKMPIGFGRLRAHWWHESVIYSNWISSLTNIVEISLYMCRSLRYLPPLERLPFLKSLGISYLYDMEYIYYEECFPRTFFPSLERLRIFSCKKLRGWCRMGDDFNCSSHHLSLPSFPCLSWLRIAQCPMLICMPTFPNLDKSLELINCSVEPLEATLKISIDFTPLSMLKSLYISGSQTSQEIEILFKDDHNCLPSLQKIVFRNCIDLKALPDWICSLSTLQYLTAVNCNDLALLPEGMPHLTNLQTLEIIECPLLIKEFQTETSATRPKTAHIPNIILKCTPFL